MDASKTSTHDGSAVAPAPPPMTPSATTPSTSHSPVWGLGGMDLPAPSTPAFVQGSARPFPAPVAPSPSSRRALPPFVAQSGAVEPSAPSPSSAQSAITSLIANQVQQSLMPFWTRIRAAAESDIRNVLHRLEEVLTVFRLGISTARRDSVSGRLQTAPSDDGNIYLRLNAVDMDSYLREVEALRISTAGQINGLRDSITHQLMVLREQVAEYVTSLRAEANAHMGTIRAELDQHAVTLRAELDGHVDAASKRDFAVQTRLAALEDGSASKSSRITQASRSKVKKKGGNDVSSTESKVDATQIVAAYKAAVYQRAGISHNDRHRPRIWHLPLVKGQNKVVDWSPQYHNDEYIPHASEVRSVSDLPAGTKVQYPKLRFDFALEPTAGANWRFNESILRIIIGDHATYGISPKVEPTALFAAYLAKTWQHWRRCRVEYEEDPMEWWQWRRNAAMRRQARAKSKALFRKESFRIPDGAPSSDLALATAEGMQSLEVTTCEEVSDEDFEDWHRLDKVYRRIRPAYRSMQAEHANRYHDATRFEEKDIKVIESAVEFHLNPDEKIPHGTSRILLCHNYASAHPGLCRDAAVNKGPLLGSHPCGIAESALAWGRQVPSGAPAKKRRVGEDGSAVSVAELDPLVERFRPPRRVAKRSKRPNKRLDRTGRGSASASASEGAAQDTEGGEDDADADADAESISSDTEVPLRVELSATAGLTRDAVLHLHSSDYARVAQAGCFLKGIGRLGLEQVDHPAVKNVHPFASEPRTQALGLVGVQLAENGEGRGLDGQQETGTDQEESQPGLLTFDALIGAAALYQSTSGASASLDSAAQKGKTAVRPRSGFDALIGAAAPSRLAESASSSLAPAAPQKDQPRLLTQMSFDAFLAAAASYQSTSSVPTTSAPPAPAPQRELPGRMPQMPFDAFLAAAASYQSSSSASTSSGPVAPQKDQPGLLPQRNLDVSPGPTGVPTFSSSSVPRPVLQPIQPPGPHVGIPAPSIPGLVGVQQYGPHAMPPPSSQTQHALDNFPSNTQLLLGYTPPGSWNNRIPGLGLPLMGTSQSQSQSEPSSQTPSSQTQSSQTQSSQTQLSQTPLFQPQSSPSPSQSAQQWQYPHASQG
ncbi:hypothetical protein OC834_002251 [Tilletia horrida]|nr:hypothetical protein OC834_002251 [Tilletia horrida]